jgi:hypothetical protein
LNDLGVDVQVDAMAADDAAEDNKDKTEVRK